MRPGLSLAGEPVNRRPGAQSWGNGVDWSLSVGMDVPEHAGDPDGLVYPEGPEGDDSSRDLSHPSLGPSPCFAPWLW